MSPATTTNILEELWDKAAGNLDQETIKWIAKGALDTARSMARNLAETIEGIGCLVSNDESAGNFQSSDDLPSLLWGISNSIDTIHGLMLIGWRAKDALDDPEALKMQVKLAKNRKGRRAEA